MAKKDLTGQTFGRLTVTEAAGVDKWGKTMWSCRCQFGKTSTVRAGNLLKANGIRSCGCQKGFAVMTFSQKAAIRWARV